MSTHIVFNTDNFGGDYPDEYALASVDAKGRATMKAFTEKQAERVAALLNEFDGNGDMSSRWWTIQRVGYKLQDGFEP
jgi:hypothetical protein